MRTLSRKSFAIGLLVALLVTYTGRAVPVSALAVGPLADPVYDTEIIAFKDYVEQNLDAPQLDIMFFLIGGLAVAQMGAQDAMLISPYPNEENVKEWIINCGIQLYNSVIGLVPEGDYYMGIPSIGGPAAQGVPRQVIKALVAQMMGDAVVAINYPDLDTFLEENPNELYLPFNKDLQLGVNAVFGLNGGLFYWQQENKPFTTTREYHLNPILGSTVGPFIRAESKVSGSYQYAYPAYSIDIPFFQTYHNIFINQNNSTCFLCDDYGNAANSFNLTDAQNTSYRFGYSSYYNNGAFGYVESRPPSTPSYAYRFSPNQPSIPQAILLGDMAGIFTWLGDTAQFFNFISSGTTSSLLRYGAPFVADFVEHVYLGISWDDKREIFNSSDLNIAELLSVSYQQLTKDYLFDLRGLMGDLVNYIYTRQPVWDNIYDPDGTLVIPDTISVSVDLTPITDLLAPPLPVNMNDIAELTDNTYLERVKEHARNAGDIFANYVAFWHNCDSDLVYTIFGAAILVLVGAFVGKWGHS